MQPAVSLFLSVIIIKSAAKVPTAIMKQQIIMLKKLILNCLFGCSGSSIEI